MKSCEVWIAFNRIIARITTLRSETVRQLSVRDPRSGRELMSFGDEKRAETAPALRFRTHSGPTIDLTFVSPAPFDPGILPGLMQGTVELKVVQDEETLTVDGRPIPMSFPQFASLSWPALEAFDQFADVGDLARAARKPIQQGATRPVHLDYCHAAHDMVYLNGWMPNFGATKSFFFNAGCALVSASDRAIPQRRPDVTEHIRGSGAAVTSDMHGFSIAVDLASREIPIQVFVLEAGALHLCYSVVPQFHSDPARMLQLTYAAQLSANRETLSRVAFQVAPFLRRTGISLERDLVQKSRWHDGETPGLSVIVPFYKQWRFLFSVLTMVRNGPADWEWVMVCDDPGILFQMTKLIQGLEARFRDRITLIAPKENVGYGHANNMGVAHASANRVLLMNSDIWVRDFAQISDHFEAIDSGSYALLGFVLQFEDGTVQHAGMEFRRSADFGDLFLAEHPGKGLPPDATSYAGELSDALAVTGALMLMTKSRFEAIGGFNDRYIGGDFEDADICLSLRSHGERIGLVHSTQIFHLERQSIRQDGANNLAAVRTLVNCERFNTRWSGILGQGAPMPREIQ